ncbi:early activation antigen CD69-like [Pelodiscus sinensis]|uniref:early activation antigen CD69-like n=1 Tax=Pelodiscus sinensis TaxID=13735 RepID=UPI003F6BFD62
MEVQVPMSPLLEPPHLSERAEVGNESCAAERMEPEASVRIPPTGEESSTVCPTGWLSALKARALPLAVLSLVLNLIFISVLIACTAKTREPCPAGAACPDGWVGYLGKCYYFSELEANWTDSQKNCSALGASLVGIDSQQEMDFLGRSKGIFDQWIGLHREPGQIWKWANGTDFNNWFPIAGGEQCGFLSQRGVASSSCQNSERWICSKPAQNPEGKMK